MAKALNQSDIVHEAERWAKNRRELDKLEAEYDAKIEAAIAPVRKKYDARIDKLQSQVDEHQSKVLGWLRKRKKSITVETKNAIARLLTGTRPGNRVPDAQKFIAACKKRKVDPWPAINVVINRAEPILGKNDFDTVCTKQSVDYAEATLELK